MGSATGQQDEQPVHQVKVDGFWIGKHEVTNAEFEAFTKDSGYLTIAERQPKPEDYPNIPPAEFANIKPFSIVFAPPNEDIPIEMLKNHNAFMAWWKMVPEASWRLPEGPDKTGFKEKMDHPVVHISWHDAVAYCRWLTQKTGIKHRLPTEAEWEYAARGGLKGKEYIWGDKQEPEGKIMANIWQGRFPRENTEKDGYYSTAPVGKYPPNGYGLYDMGGNVWEWCSDWYMPNYYGNSPYPIPQGLLKVMIRTSRASEARAARWIVPMHGSILRRIPAISSYENHARHRHESRGVPVVAEAPSPKQ